MFCFCFIVFVIVCLFCFDFSYINMYIIYFWMQNSSWLWQRLYASQMPTFLFFLCNDSQLIQTINIIIHKIILLDCFYLDIAIELRSTKIDKVVNRCFGSKVGKTPWRFKLILHRDVLFLSFPSTSLLLLKIWKQWSYRSPC